MNFSEIVTNAATGGVLGLVGTALGEIAGFVRRRQEHSQRVELAKEERATLLVKADVTAAELAGALAKVREEGASAAFTAAQQAEATATGGHVWAQTLRTITRPGLTWISYLSTMATTLALLIWPTTNEAVLALVASMQAYTGMAFSFWFGQRGIEKSYIVWGSRSTAGQVQSGATK